MPTRSDCARFHCCQLRASAQGFSQESLGPACAIVSRGSRRPRLNQFHFFDSRQRRHRIFVANSRHSEQIVWRSEDAVRTLKVETHQYAVWFEREMEQKEFK